MGDVGVSIVVAVLVMLVVTWIVLCVRARAEAHETAGSGPDASSAFPRPDQFDAVEVHLGMSLPSCVRAVYECKELRQDCVFLVPPDAVVFVDLWELSGLLPADVLTMREYEDWLPDGPTLPFARNAFGDVYYFDLRRSVDNDCPVSMYYLDGGDTELVCDSVCELLTWRRLTHGQALAEFPE